MPSKSQWWVIPVTPEPERLGHALKRLREARSMTQAEIAALLTPQVSGNQFGKYETAQATPSDDTILFLEEFFQVKPDTLFDIQTRHRKWLRSQRPLPGPSVAIPADPAITELLDALKPLSLEAIRSVAAAARIHGEQAPTPLREDKAEDK